MEDPVRLPLEAAEEDQPITVTNFVIGRGNAAFLMGMAVLAVLCVWLLSDSLHAGASSLAEHYYASYEPEKEAAYQKVYEGAYEDGEKQYHVRNTMAISMDGLQEVERLEVLTANGVEFITEDRDSNSGKVTAWLEVSGKGTFVVDLRAAECIIDHARRYVLVRAPHPELTNITITDTVKRWFADDWQNGSYREGVDLALRQRNEAGLQLQKSLMSNQYIYGSAQTVAESMIEQLVRQLNPGVPDLVVEVEFV